MLELEQPAEVEVPALDHIVGPRHGAETIEARDVVQRPGRNIEELRDVPAQGAQPVELDGLLGLPEVGPREERQAEIDRRRVERVHGRGQLHPEGLGGIERLGSIRYDDDKPTETSLRSQIKCYIALKQIIAERRFDFVGVKCHFDLSEDYVTQCIAAALCNDPDDWDGPKEPVVLSCEADADAALTAGLQAGRRPALFFDFRHYDLKEQVFVFCHCGAMATWSAERSDDPTANLQSVHRCPIIPKYGGKGCHLQYVAKEGEMTLGRLSRVMDRYTLTLFRGEVRRFPEAKLQETCPVWPHAFIRVQMDPLALVERYDSHHIHGVSGNPIAALIKFCELTGIACEVIE